jgi:imidazole glycerol phosphate synthase glutamine amidotransferase subunit
MVEVIDYGAGNTGSLCRALERLGLPHRMVDRGSGLGGDSGVILPGVGSFGAVMGRLEGRGFVSRLRDLVRGGTPFLGICVGLQVLFETSDEAGGVEGLSLLEGRVVRLDAPKVPQIGWNLVETREPDGFDSGWAYFVNSFVAQPLKDSDVLYEADYGGRFCAAVKRDAVWAFQFHPEKSGTFGHGILRRWHDAL